MRVRILKESLIHKLRIIMKKEEIDKLIIESLNKDEAEFYRNLEEEGIFKMWWRLFSGVNGWLAIIQSVFITVFAIITIYSGYHFFTVEATIELLRYGAVMFIGIIFTGMMKLWLFMQMDKNVILREMKRIEYQIAVLMEKKTEHD